MQSLNEVTSEREVGRTDDVYTHNYEQGWAHTQYTGGVRWHRQQEILGVPRCFSGGSPPLGVGVLIVKAIEILCTLHRDGSIKWEQQISMCRKRPPSEG